jgi:membrane-associated progesterone receptor component
MRLERAITVRHISLVVLHDFGADTSYSVFAGKEPNRALGLSSLKPEDCISDYSALSDKEKQVLNDWHTFFSKRYNIVGRLQAESASNL